MTAKEYLNQAYRLEHFIRLEKEEIEYWQEIACSVSSPGFEEHFNATRNTEAPFVKTIYKIMEYQERINHEIDALVELKAEMEDAIEKLSNVDERLLLRYRYLDNQSWEEIGVLLNASVRTVHRIHSSALQNFSVPE